METIQTKERIKLVDRNKDEEYNESNVSMEDHEPYRKGKFSYFLQDMYACSPRRQNRAS